MLGEHTQKRVAAHKSRQQARRLAAACNGFVHVANRGHRINIIQAQEAVVHFGWENRVGLIRIGFTAESELFERRRKLGARQRLAELRQSGQFIDKWLFVN